jgi:hypothetical protein
MSLARPRLKLILLGAVAWAMPAVAEQLVGLPAPVEWQSGPDSTAATGTGEGARVRVSETSAPVTQGQRLNRVRASCALGAQVSTSDVRGLIARVAAEEGADTKLADAIAAQESSYDQRRISPKGAIGVMQLMPETASRYQADPCELESNIRGGVRYLRDLSAEFGGNVMLVLAAYSAGPDRVYAAKGVPPIAETVRYVAAVTNAYYGFDNALASSGAVRRRVTQSDASATPSPDAAKASVTGGANRWIGGSVLYVDQTQGGDQ